MLFKGVIVGLSDIAFGDFFGPYLNKVTIGTLSDIAKATSTDIHFVQLPGFGSCRVVCKSSQE